MLFQLCVRSEALQTAHHDLGGLDVCALSLAVPVLDQRRLPQHDVPRAQRRTAALHQLGIVLRD